MERYSALSLQNTRTRIVAPLIKEVVIGMLRVNFKLNNLVIWDQFIDRRFHAPDQPSDLVLRIGHRSLILTAIGDVDAEGSFAQLSHTAAGYKLNEARWELLCSTLVQLIYQFYRSPERGKVGFHLHQAERPKSTLDLLERTFTRVSDPDAVHKQLVSMYPDKERHATYLAFVGGNVHVYQEHQPQAGIVYRRGLYNPDIHPMEDLPNL